MTNIFEFLSGGVPGGAILVIAALIFTNLAIHFLFKSGLFSGGLVKKYIGLNVLVLSVYLVIWVYNKPAPLPNRIIVLPSGSEQKFELSASSLKLAEFFEQYGYQFEGRYLTHKWRWMYNSLGKERSESYKRWLQLGKDLNPSLLISSHYNNQDELIVKAVFSNSDSKNIEAKITTTDWESGLRSLLTGLNLKLKENKKISLIDDKYLTTKIKIVEDKIEEAFALVKDDTTKQGLLCYGETLVSRGLKFIYDQEKLKYVDITNPDFELAKSVLYPLFRSEFRSSEVAYLLGRMAIREQEYEGAEVFFKIAFSQELWNSDIYYYLSFLLPSRLEELGYKNRKKILEKTVQLNPGNTKAVFDLANRYYITGNGAEQGSGTQDALKTLENYLKLNDEDPKIQGLLATFYIKTEKLDQAEAIYNNMAERYPDDSNIVYNLGIVYYTAAQYEKALQKFKEAIKMDNNLDAYLYVGITYEMLGDLDLALKYYQDRVRNNINNDDYYAKEAMRGIRNILEKKALEDKGKIN